MEDNQFLTTLIAAVKLAGGVPPELELTREDDTTLLGGAAGAVSLVCGISDAKRHPIIDDVWEALGFLRVYVPECTKVTDADRRVLVKQLGKAIENPEINNVEVEFIDILNDESGAGDNSVKWFEFERRGPVKWSSEGREVWGDIEWRCIVEVASE